MARKKPRTARPGHSQQTAIVPQPAVTGISTSPTTATLSARASPELPSVKKSDRFWLEALIVRLSHWLGSLQVAVVGLLAFALFLALGTIVESRFTGPIAQQYVYHTWWFTLLLTILGLNIFFAAAKKWPWKKHQTGFIITHVGLLLLVGSGLLTKLFGTDALMEVVDSADRHFQDEARASQVTSLITDRDSFLIRVQKPNSKKEDVYPFQPGALPWRADEYTEARTDTVLRILDWFAHPFGHGWRQDLGDGAELDVLAYYPHVREEPVSKASSEDRETFPAVRFQLSSVNFGTLPEKWTAGSIRHRSVNLGPGEVQMLGRCPAVLLNEFHQPPQGKDLGEKGQLVVALGSKVFRFNVAEKLGQTLPLEGTEYKILLTRYQPDFQSEDPNGPPKSPVVLFELKVGDNAAKFAAAAVLIGQPVPQKGDKEIHAAVEDDLKVWYHPPDPRFANERLAGVLQFATDSRGQLHYRSFSGRGPEFKFEKAGTVKEGDTLDVWTRMGGKVEIKEYLERAVDRKRYVPEDLRPGLEHFDYSPAIRCRLTVTGKGGKKEFREFWVKQTMRNVEAVTVGDHTFSIGYTVNQRDLGLQIKLLRAEQTVDPGTNQPATYTSFVQLTDEKAKIVDEDHVITMNEPLEHNGYKFYQSGYLSLGPDFNLKPVSRSVFTVGKDPGIWLKYAGSTMLALGIFVMFYMKAYFFKPRRRKAA